jgi:hypothetical protein
MTGSLGLAALPNGEALRAGWAFLAFRAGALALRLGGAFLLATGLSVSALWFFGDIVQIAGRNRFGDLASLSFG